MADRDRNPPQKSPTGPKPGGGDSPSAAVSGTPSKEGRIGPHELRELELMLRGEKPFALFSDTVPPSYEMPEAGFAPHVASGAIVRSERIYTRDGMPFPIRFVYFALAPEAWRIEAMHAINEALFVRGEAPTEETERETGRLLGYTDADIERYLAGFSTKRTA